MDLGTHISFKGQLQPRFHRVPKSQLAYSILGNKQYKDFSITRQGEYVKGVIVRNVAAEDKDRYRQVKGSNLKRGQVREIRNLKNTGKNNAEIAKMYGLLNVTITKIVNRKGEFDFE